MHAKWRKKMYVSMWNHANKLCSKSWKTHIRTLMLYLVLKKMKSMDTCSSSVSQEIHIATDRSSPHTLLLFPPIWELQMAPDTHFSVYINGNRALRCPQISLKNLKCKCSALALWGHQAGSAVPVPHGQHGPILQASVGFPGILHQLWNG